MLALLVLVMIAGVAFIFALPYIEKEITYSRSEGIRTVVFSGDFMTADQFERDWSRSDFIGKYGSRFVDGPGCYIILMFDSPVANGDYSRYINGYIGQSINACARVHNHLTGKGNGDVYADRKSGKYLYVKIITCEISELNDLETRLIASFDWDRLYNRSKGGGSKHEGIPDRKYSGNYASATKEVRPRVHSSTQPSSYSNRNESARPRPPQSKALHPPDFLDSSTIELLKTKAVNGDIDSQYKLGMLYEQGRLVSCDYYYAAMWYRMASNCHHQNSIIHLAMMYKDGRGVPKNLDTAVRMLEPLASSGNKNAKDILNCIQRNQNN